MIYPNLYRPLCALSPPPKERQIFEFEKGGSLERLSFALEVVSDALDISPELRSRDLGTAQNLFWVKSRHHSVVFPLRPPTPVERAVICWFEERLAHREAKGHDDTRSDPLKLLLEMGEAGLNLFPTRWSSTALGEVGVINLRAAQGEGGEDLLEEISDSGLNKGKGDLLFFKTWVQVDKKYRSPRRANARNNIAPFSTILTHPIPAILSP